MLTTTKAIVLSKIKYNDNDLIIKCYTKERGVVSYLLKRVLKSSKGRTKIAYYQLASQIEIEEHYKQNQNLHFIKEVKFCYLYKTLHSNVFKGSVVMFLSEVLSYVLKEEEKNEALYNYLESTLQWLDNDTNFSNFHLLFLLKLTQYLGFYPDTTQIAYNYFNLRTGVFELKKQDKYSISDKNIIILKQLLGMNFDTLNTLKISSTERQSFLNILLVYLELHLGDFKTPKSLTVFNQVFS